MYGQQNIKLEQGLCGLDSSVWREVNIFPFVRPLLQSASLKGKEYIFHLKVCGIKGYSVFHRLKYLILSPEWFYENIREVVEGEV